MRRPPQGWAAIVGGTDGPLVVVRREKPRTQVVVVFDLMKSNSIIEGINELHHRSAK